MNKYKSEYAIERINMRADNALNSAESDVGQARSRI
jgi:hypothetical protein